MHVLDLPQLKPPMNDMAMNLYTRSILESSIEQHEAGLVFKRQDLQEEQNRLEQDEAIWHQLQEVEKGLEMRKLRLIEKENQRRTPGDLTQTMQNKINTVEENINELLSSLISISDSLFSEEEGDKRRQLRHLIDVSLVPRSNADIDCADLGVLFRDSSMLLGTLLVILGSMWKISICHRLSPFSFVLILLWNIQEMLGASAWCNSSNNCCTICHYCTI